MTLIQSTLGGLLDPWVSCCMCNGAPQNTLA